MGDAGFANRTVMQDSSRQPRCRTFQKGLDFLAQNHDKDNWFLQIETFDPHEPFFCQPEYQQLFPDSYDGPFCDWPDYRPVNEEDSPEFITHLRHQYASVLKLCDENLGKVLDAMDHYNLWKDTMLIVNTGSWVSFVGTRTMGRMSLPVLRRGSPYAPLYLGSPKPEAECANQPAGPDHKSPATLLEYFGLPLFPDMEGKPLRSVINRDLPVREGALFGIFGGQICCTDGKWVYMRSPLPGNQPRYEYTLMPTRHGGRRAFINNDILPSMELSSPFPYKRNSCSEIRK